MNMHKTPLRALIAVLFFVLFASAGAEGVIPAAESVSSAGSTAKFSPVFPYALTQKGAAELSVFTDTDYASAAESESAHLQSVLLNNDVFALYGKPGSKSMGILGQYTLEGLEPIMNDFVKQYDAVNGDRGIIPALYIIYGTCWPEGDIGILSDSVVRQYIEFAAARGWYVYLDHQIGKYTVEQAVNKLLPWLQYPNVQLALDPEWRTTKPMQEIGYVTADELNKAQQMVQDYLIAHGISGRRMLVVHQFKPKMISNRSAVRSDFDLVQLIHCADGFGSPTLKRNAYASNAEARNIPLKSFKLFLKSTVIGAGWDEPLMSPAEVMQLNPRPYIIMYQ